jgi:hypothetical protein
MNKLEDLEVFTILEFGIFLAKNPRYHLSSFHAGTNDVSIFIPTVRTFLWPLE